MPFNGGAESVTGVLLMVATFGNLFERHGIILAAEMSDDVVGRNVHVSFLDIDAQYEHRPSPSTPPNSGVILPGMRPLVTCMGLRSLAKGAAN
jgi:hypothetical protein